MKIRCISDVHLGSGDGADDFMLDDQGFARYLNAATKEEPIVILGDLFDIWESKEWDGRRERARDIYARHKLVVEAIVKGIGEERIFYVPGNHDRDVPEGIFDGVSPCAALLTHCSEKTMIFGDGAVRALATHGDIWDDANYKLWFVGRLITLVVGWIQRLGWKDAPRWLEDNIESRIPGRVAGNGAYIPKAIAAATRADCKCVVMGHTHSEQVVGRDGVVYVNTGRVCGRRGGLNESVVSLDTGGVSVTVRTVAI